MLRNARDEVTTEALEIATYDTIESIARGLGDHETAELAATVRLDEERMLDALRKEIPVLTDLIVSSALVDGNREIEEPWGGYDDMTVDQIKSRLSDATPSLLVAVRVYEESNKNRTTVIEATEKETISV
jgi:hypothetical protein